MRYDFQQGTRTAFGRAVAAEVRAMLGAERMSGNALAKSIGLSQNYVAKRLRDEAAFSLDDLALVAAHFETDAHVIVASAERHLERAYALADDVLGLNADPLPAGAFSKGDLDLAADVDPDAKADED